MELAENQLTGDELKHLKKYASSLETLKLGNNKITKWADVEQLGCMKKLKNLDLEKNDVTKIDGYTEKMWALFEGSALEILDNHNREGEEGFSEDIDDYGSSLDNEGEGKFVNDFYGDEGFEGGEDDMDDLENEDDEDQAEAAEANKRAKH